MLLPPNRIHYQGCSEAARGQIDQPLLAVCYKWCKETFPVTPFFFLGFFTVTFGFVVGVTSHATPVDLGTRNPTPPTQLSRVVLDQPLLAVCYKWCKETFPVTPFSWFLHNHQGYQLRLIFRLVKSQGGVGMLIADFFGSTLENMS